MKKIQKIVGQTIPLAMNDVDTDLIIPAQYLTSTDTKGFGQYAFQRLKEQDANFVFNQPQFRKANILISRHSFGCGSSREHAVWALQEAGIEAVIAISFADIFTNNSSKNGLVLITLPEATINSMLIFAAKANYTLSIDIEKESITSSENERFEFKLDPFSQYCFLNGLDDVDYLLEQQDRIAEFKKQQKNRDYIAV